jgi:hypothetical protein
VAGFGTPNVRESSRCLFCDALMGVLPSQAAWDVSSPDSPDVALIGADGMPDMEPSPIGAGSLGLAALLEASLDPGTWGSGTTETGQKRDAPDASPRTPCNRTVAIPATASMFLSHDDTGAQVHS